MNLEQWAKAQNLSWEKVARELSLITMRLTRNSYTGAPGHALYSARLWRLRTGATKARPYELQALQELTGAMWRVLGLGQASSDHCITNNKNRRRESGKI